MKEKKTCRLMTMTALGVLLIFKPSPKEVFFKHMQLQVRIRVLPEVKGHFTFERSPWLSSLKTCKKLVNSRVIAMRKVLREMH